MVQTFWHETASNEEFITSALIKLIIANLSLSCAFMKLNFNPMFIAYKYGWVDRALDPKIDKLMNWRFVKENTAKQNVLLKIWSMVQTFWYNTALDEESFGAALIKLIVANLSLILACLPP